MTECISSDMRFNGTLALTAVPMDCLFIFRSCCPVLQWTLVNWGTSRLDEISENSARHRFRKTCGIRMCTFLFIFWDYTISFNHCSALIKEKNRRIPRWLQSSWKLHLLAPSFKLDLQLSYRATNLKNKTCIADLNCYNPGVQEKPCWVLEERQRARSCRGS